MLAVNTKQIVKLIEATVKDERPVYVHRKLDEDQVDMTIVTNGFWAVKLPSDSEVFDSRKFFPRLPELGEKIRINNANEYLDRVVEGRELWEFLDKDFAISKPAEVTQFKYTADRPALDKNLTIIRGEGLLQPVQDRFLKIVGKNHFEIAGLFWRSSRKFGPLFVTEANNGSTWSFVVMPVQIEIPELKALEPTEQKVVELTEYNVA